MTSTAACPSFTLRELLQSLPEDGATRFVRVSNVVSPMSHSDVCELFRIPPARRAGLRWRTCCSVYRTDFVVELDDEDEARQAIAFLKGVTFQNHNLATSFAAALPAVDAVEYQGTSFSSAPKLYYSLPKLSEAEAARRKQDTLKKIEKIEPIVASKEWWVDVRDAEKKREK